MNEQDWETDVEDLSSAEDFLEFFGVPYQPRVVHVNRLHILQRFHDYLAAVQGMPDDPRARFRLHADLLARAYADFVESDAVTERVFKVFRQGESEQAFVPLGDLLAKKEP